MSHLPFFQFYPADWIQDTRLLSLAARGAWIDLLCAMWIAPERGKLTWTWDMFCSFVGLQNRPKEAVKIWQELFQSQIGELTWQSDNKIVTLMSRRMIREEAKRNKGLERVKRFRNASVTLLKRSIYQKSEVRSHISEEEKTTKSSVLEVKVSDWPSPQKLVEFYNAEAADELPAIELLSDARKKKARAYLSKFPKEEFWHEVFAETRKSEFLRGMNNRNGHEGFSGNLDWLLTKGKDGTENCVKVFEGRYRDAKR